MGHNSSIEWTDHTFNPWWGCIKVSQGCKNCYAEKLDNRYNHEAPHWGPKSSRKTMSDAYWKQPIKWNKEAERDGVRRRVFCASMADVFEIHADTMGERERLFDLIAATPWLDWLLLTKRPENIMGLVPHSWENGFPPNVWVMTSAENQEELETRVAHLIKVPAIVRGLSCEPLLSELDISLAIGKTYPAGKTYSPGIDIHWIIAGGESGPGARPMHPDWARSLRDQCDKYAIAYFFKQWGEYKPKYNVPISRMIDLYGQTKRETLIDITGGRSINKQPAYLMERVGKHAAGNEIDGQVHQNLPKNRL